MDLRRSALSLVLFGASLLIAGCGGTHQSASTPKTMRNVAFPPAVVTGVVAGTLAIYGGVLETDRCGCVLAAGTVRLIGAHGGRIDVNVGRSGRFSVRVPAGRYEVIAGLKHPFDWPMGSCS